jgi:transposase
MLIGFWLSDRAWAAIEPLLPKNQPGARRVDEARHPSPGSLRAKPAIAQAIAMASGVAVARVAAAA